MSNGNYDLIDFFNPSTEYVSQGESLIDFYNPPAEMITPGSNDLVDFYNPPGGWVSIPISAAPSTPSLADILGKVVDVSAKTFSEILKVKYAQPVLKTVPSVQSGIEKYAYYPAKATQTGLPLTTYATGQGSLIGGIPNIYLIAGAGLLVLFLAMR